MVSYFFTAAHLSHRHYRANERAGYADLDLGRNRIRRHSDLFRRSDFVDSRLPTAPSAQRGPTRNFEFASNARLLHGLPGPCRALFIDTDSNYLRNPE